MFSGGQKHYTLLFHTPPPPGSFWIILCLSHGLLLHPSYLGSLHLLLSPFSPHLLLPEELTTAPMINTNTLSSHSLSSPPPSRLWTTKLHPTLPGRPGDVPKQLKTLSWLNLSPQTICVLTSSVTAWCAMEWISCGELAKGYQKMRGTQNSRKQPSGKGRQKSAEVEPRGFEEELAESRLGTGQENTVYLLPTPQHVYISETNS